MTPDRRQIEQIYHSTLEREESQRSSFLKEACEGDEELRRKVETLLAHKDQAESFIEMPVLETAAKGLAGGQPQTLVGRQIASYQILSLLGVGGMGEVYKVRDTKLDRIDALKILPTDLACDQERMRRFVREAKAASALKHPNVATIYEIGKSDDFNFIAMEYVEGQTLAARISGRPVPIAEIVDIGIQVADALDEAHRKGITHRDIKPGNLMVTPRGQVKVLDFGLAKVTLPEGQTIGSDISTVVKTETGVVMGTVQYMSPEQVLGKEVDHRTDIFSAGVVLYEMATGRLPFSGSSVSETTDRILHGQPDAIARFNYNVPPELDRIIRKCLEKDRERRYQSARDLLIDLRSLKRESGGEHVLHKTAHRKTSWIALGVFGIGLLALVATGVGWYLSRSRSTSTPEPSPPIPLTSYPGTELSPSFSPDGSQVAFSWDGEQQDNFDIYVKPIDRVDAHRLTRDPARDLSPAWSPDGRTIAFAREGAVFLIPPTGGAETKLDDVRAADIEWARDSKSLIVTGLPRKLLRLFVDTRDTKELTSPPREADPFFGDSRVAVSPDGLNLAFVRSQTAGSSDLYLMPVTGGEPRRLTQNESQLDGITWTADGREIVYSSRGVLLRRSTETQPDSLSRRVEGVDPAGARGPVISRPVSGAPVRLAYERIVLDTNIWMRDTRDPAAPARKLIGSTRGEFSPQFSPNGSRIAFISDRSGMAQVWVANRNGSNQLPLTSFTAGLTTSPRWSPDGSQIVFSSMQNNNRDLYSISPDGGPLQRLTEEASEEGRPSWSRDGRWIYCYSKLTGRDEIWRIPAKGGKGVQVTVGGGHESFESPDGKILYYEDFGNKGLRSLSTENSSWPREGAVVLPAVRPGFWAVAEKGIYFVQLDDWSPAQFIHYDFGAGTAPRPIQFYDFQSRKETQIGAIQKPLIRSNPGFSVTWDGRYLAWSQVDQGETDLMMVENFR